MKRMKRIMALLFCIGSLTLMRCSLVSGPLAGGSGLGNPPTNVAIAMVADTGLPALGKKAATDLSLANNTSGRRLSIKDPEGLMYTVTAATITVQYIRFVVAAPESLSVLVLDKGLAVDATGIVIPGPFVFDVINNIVDPPLDSIRLPRTRYLGVEMVVNKKDTLPSIEISGDFTYAGTLHGFVFSLVCNKRFMCGISDGFSLLDTPATTITVRMNASTWLDSVDMGTCLDKGWIGFDSNGVLDVDDKMPQGCNKYSQIIQENIVNSGRLELEKR